MKLLREPLVHFLALGAALFVLFAIVGNKDAVRTDRIVVSSGQIAQLTEAWSRTWQRPPTRQELDSLIEDHVREEVYYREALAMGLDRDDTIVRRRLRQKLEFFTHDLVDAAVPTEEALEAFRVEHAEKFRTPPIYSFEQIYFSGDRRGQNADRDARALLARLQATSDKVDSSALGDPLMIPSAFERASTSEIASQLGGQFATALEGLAIGSWQGPITSGFGLHLVRVREREEQTSPPLPEIRDRVEREWRTAQREAATEAFYSGLRARYEVSIEAPTSDAAGADGANPEVASSGQ